MAKKYEELTFADDFMFCKILENNPDLCRELLSLILDRPVGPLAPITSQKPIEITAGGKGVRFDVYAKDDDKIIYNIEMQNVANDNIAKRARYSQGMIDLNLIERGAKYEELNRSYVIYICQFNIHKMPACTNTALQISAAKKLPSNLGMKRKKSFSARREPLTTYPRR